MFNVFNMRLAASRKVSCWPALPWRGNSRGSCHVLNVRPGAGRGGGMCNTMALDIPTSATRLSCMTASSPSTSRPSSSGSAVAARQHPCSGQDSTIVFHNFLLHRRSVGAAHGFARHPSFSRVFNADLWGVTKFDPSAARRTTEKTRCHTESEADQQSCHHEATALLAEHDYVAGFGWLLLGTDRRTS